MSGAEVARKTDGAGNVDSARSADANSFLINEIENQLNGLGIGNLIGEIRRKAFKVGGDSALTDPFGDRAAGRGQFAMGIEVIERGTLRVGNADLDVRVLRLQSLRYAGKCAAGTDGADKTIHLAVRIAPDFG